MIIRKSLIVIPIDLYRSNLIFVCNQKVEKHIQEFLATSCPRSYTDDDINDLMKWFKRSDKGEAGVHFMHKGDCFIRIFGPILDPCDMGTLSHEVTHCVNRLLLDKGMELSDASDEAFCHLHGYLMEKIFLNE